MRADEDGLRSSDGCLDIFNEFLQFQNVESPELAIEDELFFEAVFHHLVSLERANSRGLILIQDDDVESWLLAIHGHDNVPD